MKSKCMILTVAVASAVLLPNANAQLSLGTATTFGVLGGSTVTSTGNTIVNGDLGVHPGTAITGFGPGIVNGGIYPGGAVAAQAQADALTAYNVLAGEAVTSDLTGVDLGAQTLTLGVYKFDSSAGLTGQLTLDGQGDSNARFVFQIGTTLTTASASSVHLINGAQAENVFWQIGSSATLGTDTGFAGTILADASITLTTGADLVGRALALKGAVTLDDNTVTVPVTVPIPEPAGTMLFAGLLGLFVGARRVRRHSQPLAE